MNWLKNSWKMALTIVTALGIITALAAFNAHYASSEDLQKAKTEAAVNLEKAKVETKAAIQEMKKSMELDRDINRLNTVNDSLMKARIQQRTYPKDKDIKEDIENLKKEKDKIQEKIEKRDK